MTDKIEFNIIAMSRLYRFYYRIEIIKDNMIHQSFDLTKKEFGQFKEQINQIGE